MPAATLADWKAKYGTGATAHVVVDYPDGAFVVAAGALSFSVTLFVICALICIGALVLRRKLCGNELGGPAAGKWATFFGFVTLWLIYILGSIGKTEGWW